jgi:hypothetical protein
MTVTWSSGPNFKYRAWHKTCLNCGIPVHLVDGISDWLISIMKDFDWLQVHINNSFKNSSVKATIKVKRVYQIPLSNFFEFLFFCALWQKIHRTNSILKGLYQNRWRSLDTRRWKNSKTSHVFESLLFTTKMSLQLFCQLASAKVLFIRSYRHCFLSYIRLLRGTIENFVVAVVIPL